MSGRLEGTKSVQEVWRRRCGGGGVEEEVWRKKVEAVGSYTPVYWLRAPGVVCSPVVSAVLTIGRLNLEWTGIA